MSWEILLPLHIIKQLDKLNRSQLIALTKELKLLELCGNELRMPHSKSLGKGLFELRERQYHFRIYYEFIGEKRINLLCIGNKTTQQIDIKKAHMLKKRNKELEYA